MKEKRLFDAIEHGDRVTIITSYGQKRTGTARIKNDAAGAWVLNAGGRFGSPVIATPDNIVFVKKNKPKPSRTKKQAVDTCTPCKSPQGHSPVEEAWETIPDVLPAR